MALRYRRCIYNGKLHWEDTELADHTWKYEILVRARVVAKLHKSVAEKRFFSRDFPIVYSIFLAQQTFIAVEPLDRLINQCLVPHLVAERVP